MVKIRKHELLYILYHALFSFLLGLSIIAYHRVTHHDFSEELLIFLIVPIVFAAFRLQSRIYLVLLGITLITSVWVVIQTVTNLIPSFQTISLISLTLIITCEFVNRAMRKQNSIDQSIRYDRDLLERITDTSPSSIVVVDRSGIITYANSKAIEVLGLNPVKNGKRTYDSPDWHITTVDGQPVSSEALPFYQVLTTQKPIFDACHAIEIPGGNRRILSINGAPLFSAEGNVESVVFSIEDITHRVQTEKALRESEKKFRTIFLACPMGMYLYRLDEGDRLILVDANAQADTMTGVVNRGKIGLTIEEAFPALANTEVPRHYRAAARDGIPYHVINMPYKDADIEGLFDVYTFQTSPGQIAVMFNEVTERQNLEAQLLQSQKMESIGQLAGGIAHDFNNLLTGILGYVDLILPELNETDPIVPMAREIKNAGNRAASLTRQLLAFSRKQVFKTRVVDLNELIMGLDTMLHRLIGENIKIVTELHEEVWPIKADPAQIEQIIINLALNARDAMPQGGTLTIETENRSRYDKNQPDSANKPGAYAVLRIRDTGYGMPPDILSHVFEPFFTTKPKDKGTGLGLSMVYGIVKQSEGDIDVQSEPNQGTVFEILFPRTTETAIPSPQPTGQRQTGEQGSETILVVEDEEMVRSLIVNILETSGYRVLQAGLCDEAFHIHESYDGPIHLLITDVILPKKSGKEIASVIQTARPDMHVLFVSGYTDDAITHHGVLDADVHFMQKPFTASVLKQKIREIFHEDTAGAGLEE